MSTDNKEVISISALRLESKVQGVTELFQLCEYIMESEGLISLSLDDIEEYKEALIQTYKEQHAILVAKEINN